MKLPTSRTKMIVLTGLLAGTLDATAAMVVHQVMPIPIFKFIASGAFGKDAYAGGIEMVLAGVLFHYFIAFSWTILYFVLYPKLKFLAKSKILSGLGYGVVVWIVMNRVILPLTLVARGPFTWKGAVIGAVILMFMIGLPIAILAHKYYNTYHEKHRVIA